MILGCAALGILMASAAVDEAALETGFLGRLPACSARAAGGSCALCGMSHSLVAMSRGRWDEAAGWNTAGPWLYGALLLLAAAGALIAFRALAAATARGSGASASRSPRRCW